MHLHGLPAGDNPDPFRQLMKAYGVLTDPEKGAAYDIKYQEYWDRKWQFPRTVSIMSSRAVCT